MKISFVGKGGAGKTTLASLTARYLASKQFPVLVIDADINQHMGYSLGLHEDACAAIPKMGLEMEKIKEYLRGTNSRIGAIEEMAKTTPPGTGSRLLTVTEENPIYKHFVRDVDGVRLMTVGALSEKDIGVKCYHASTGSVELFLNHLIDVEREYVLVDMTAGTDAFASGLFTRFDVTFLVVEPTVKSVSVYKQYKAYAEQYAICIRVIGNKVRDTSDATFIQREVADDLVALFQDSPYVQSFERGDTQPISYLEPENENAVSAVVEEIDTKEKDWEKFYDQAVVFHRKNAESWANSALGVDITEQVDPSYSLMDEVVRMQPAHTIQ